MTGNIKCAEKTDVEPIFTRASPASPGIPVPEDMPVHALIVLFAEPLRGNRGLEMIQRNLRASYIDRTRSLSHIFNDSGTALRRRGTPAFERAKGSFHFAR